MRIFELVDLVSNMKNKEVENLKNQFLEYDEILQLYYSGDWKSAHEKLNNYLTRFNSDLVALALNVRLKSFELNPPENWNGVFRMHRK